jgi:hypothetical protein
MHRSLPLLALSLAACLEEDLPGEATMPTCADTATALSLDEVSALGFAPADLLALSEGAHEETLTWADDRDTAVVVTVSAPTDARFVESEAVYPDSDEPSPAIAIECSDRVEVDLQLSVATADGALDEAWDAVLSGERAELASVQVELDLGALGGSLDFEAFVAEPAYDDARAWVRADFDASGSSGAVEGQVSGEEEGCDGGDDCFAWASLVPIATWGAALSE